MNQFRTLSRLAGALLLTSFAALGAACSEETPPSDMPGDISLVREQADKVRVVGRHFGPEREVHIRMYSGITADSDRRQLIAETKTNEDGSFDALVDIPATWSDGAPVAATVLAILAITPEDPTHADVAVLVRETQRQGAGGPSTPSTSATAVPLERLPERIAPIARVEPSTIHAARLEGRELVVTTGLNDGQADSADRICIASSLTELSTEPERVIVRGENGMELAWCQYQP